MTEDHDRPAKIIIHNQDKEAPTDIVHPIVIVLDRLRSAFNVGNIIRLADVCGVEQVITCGYTATPPHPKVTKTALGAEEYVNTSHFESSLAAVQHLKAQGYFTVGIETVEGAPNIWETEYPFPVAFIFGNEALGVEQETLLACDQLAKLPAYGKKNSLNVANCASVVVYDAIARLV